MCCGWKCVGLCIIWLWRRDIGEVDDGRARVFDDGKAAPLPPANGRQTDRSLMPALPSHVTPSAAIGRRTVQGHGHVVEQEEEDDEDEDVLEKLYMSWITWMSDMNS